MEFPNRHGFVSNVFGNINFQGADWKTKAHVALVWTPSLKRYTTTKALSFEAPWFKTKIPFQHWGLGRQYSGCPGYGWLLHSWNWRKDPFKKCRAEDIDDIDAPDGLGLDDPEGPWRCEEPAFTRHKRCEANFHLDAGSLETYEAWHRTTCW